MAYSKEQLAKMWLLSVEKISKTAIKKLLTKYQTYQNVFEHLAPVDEKIVGTSSFQDMLVLEEKGLSAMEEILHQANTVAYFKEDALYPQNLLKLYTPPEVIYVRGNIHAFDLSVGIVGSRIATRYGQRMTDTIATELASNGVAIISGLARGIDTAAHVGALKGKGVTIAVLGGGFMHLYPKENTLLAQNIVNENGALVSEYAPYHKVQAFHFPERNRIISGMSDALLLIEGTKRSGTRTTINHALEQGKTIYALPGNVDSPGSELPLELLKSGAMICTCAEDILKDFHIFQKKVLEGPKKSKKSPQPLEDPILFALQRETKNLEELLQETQISTENLLSRLTMLEIEGKIEKLPGNEYALCGQ